MEKKKTSLWILLFLQAAVLIFSFSGIMGKLASSYEFLEKNFILYYGLEIVLLGIYAIIWQQVIKRIDISVAYANKATNIFWSMLLAFLFFKEQISIKNIIGVIIIFIGVLVVNRND